MTGDALRGAACPPVSDWRISLLAVLVAAVLSTVAGAVAEEAMDRILARGGAVVGSQADEAAPVGFGLECA